MEIENPTAKEIVNINDKEIFKVHNKDSRLIDSVIKDQIVDVTITSPPYFDLKDYGCKNQIGYGQKYDEYLEDLKKVFANVYECTKDSGSLWVIIDAFRRDGEVIPLPFDFSNKIREAGWKLQEVIIWGKDRTVPWTHHGQMRNLFEYILMFSKTDRYNFYVDEVRDFESLKKWWVKYPERYNPKGKTPDAIWNFDIPVQGSWGDGYIKHFCPLPEEMIAQILKLTTREDDIVLDVFSGSGAVLSKADNMKRRFIGFELNPEYISMFNKYLEKTGNQKRRQYELDQRNLLKQDLFKKLIIELRALKYARVFYKKLRQLDNKDILKIYVEKSRTKPKKDNSIAVVDYSIFIEKKSNTNKLINELNNIISKAPLSKFGIEARFHFITNLNGFINLLEKKKLYVYTDRITHKFKKKFDLNDVSNMKKTDIILSKIKVNLDEKDYE